ncbi:FAD linked oxidase-like protein [Shewanella denitrificans OS217]|jgi:hypothetical protein|uniref:FAD linked oxidase-like protein n=1 Tax=Shewanella denitrificans (strain OS217 / ATCC BAA-1090 / DSM 15013) TaxID=318161 RepID=Q12JE4_SHEDO|nr:FAD-dependent oxidoreductase [Shewanella denitrificans]ABE56432.1 FAD linked oxidase-like protein [Shewanella denitrificans OS217]
MSIDLAILKACEAQFSTFPLKPEFIWACDPKTDLAYQAARKVFNRKFDFMPPLIIKVKNTEQVAMFMAFANKHILPFTVRSGGHDHEGECTATGKVLLDFSLMDHVEIKPGLTPYRGQMIKQLAVQPGARFQKIKPVLDQAHLAIAHGTCKTVAIAGYTMGGGWGPWTRKYGMGCERLTGATLVLGNGDIRFLGSSATFNTLTINLKTEQENDELLWALRGGGGLSYGIVTELFFEPFDLPQIAKSFVIKRTTFPVLSHIKAVHIIAAWEQVIAQGNNPHLIGTNLQMIAKPVANEQEVSCDALLDWNFNGHFGGTPLDLLNMVLQWVKTLGQIVRRDKSYARLGKPLLDQGDVKSIKDSFDKAMPANTWYQLNTKANNQIYPLHFDHWDRVNNGLTLEDDCPSPHKITSRMPTPYWNKTSREQLVCSLQSRLLHTKECNTVSAYITLGAISGEYYAKKLSEPKELQLPVAFPYQTSAFTIQYQAWWDQPNGKDCAMTEQDIIDAIPNRLAENRAQDWIASCRDFPIKHTKGAFISFKDASVTTEQYFTDNYHALIDVKTKHSKDVNCLLRSRKTII